MRSRFWQCRSWYPPGERLRRHPEKLYPCQRLMLLLRIIEDRTQRLIISPRHRFLRSVWWLTTRYGLLEQLAKRLPLEPLG